jgi:hexosaminidase
LFDFPPGGFFQFARMTTSLVIVPYPNRVTLLDGTWTLTTSSAIGYDSAVPGALEIADLAAAHLRPAAGFPLPIINGPPDQGIYFTNRADLTTRGEYVLDIDPSLVRIGASARTGLFYGFQTLLQILSPSFSAPALSIADRPRFQWRGLLLDTCRHFQTVPTVKKVLRLMARYKLNVLHFHLTEDQGWRLESERFPRLTEVGSVRVESDGPYGPFYYTRSEIRDLIAFGHSLEITIVPEIEMPGHSLAALSAYPEFSCTGGPFTPWAKWGVQGDIFCAGNDACVTFLESVLDEVIDLFDSEYIHTGGDEAPHTRWAACAKCRARMASLGLSTTKQLQSWFTAHIARHIAGRGRRLIAWDEVADGGIPDGAAVMSWRGAGPGQRAAAAGHDVVMSPQTHAYLDHGQLPCDDDHDYIGGLSAVRWLYVYDPTDGIPAEHAAHVLGMQGNLWTEYVDGEADLEWKLFPRAAAVAEIAWTEGPAKDWGRFVAGFERIEAARLAALDVNAAPIDPGNRRGWTPETIDVSWTTITWPVVKSVTARGTYEVAFVYTGGANALKVKDVKMGTDGSWTGVDEHEGVAGPTPVANIYSFTTSSWASEASITATVAGDGGTDSAGSVLVYWAGAPIRWH